MKAIEHYFPVVLFITLYKMVLTLESMDEFLKCEYSMKARCFANVIWHFCFVSFLGALGKGSAMFQDAQIPRYPFSSRVKRIQAFHPV